MEIRVILVQRCMADIGAREVRATMKNIWLLSGPSSLTSLKCVFLPTDRILETLIKWRSSFTFSRVVSRWKHFSETQVSQRKVRGAGWRIVLFVKNTWRHARRCRRHPLEILISGFTERNKIRRWLYHLSPFVFFFFSSSRMMKVDLLNIEINQRSFVEWFNRTRSRIVRWDRRGKVPEDRGRLRGVVTLEPGTFPCKFHSE